MGSRDTLLSWELKKHSLLTLDWSPKKKGRESPHPFGTRSSTVDPQKKGENYLKGREYDLILGRRSSTSRALQYTHSQPTKTLVKRTKISENRSSGSFSRYKDHETRVRRGAKALFFTSKKKFNPASLSNYAVPIEKKERGNLR